MISRVPAQHMLATCLHPHSPGLTPADMLGSVLPNRITLGPRVGALTGFLSVSEDEG